MLDLKNMKPKKDPFDTVWLPRNYSNLELSNFDTKYRSHQFKSETEFLKYVQAINNYGAVYVNVRKMGFLAYDYWNNLLRQWRDWVSRKEFAIKQS